MTAPLAREPLPEETWRGILNHLLYVVQFDRELGDATIDEIAEKMVVRRGLTAGPEVYYQAFSQALHAEYLVGPQSIPMAIPHDDAALRDVIARLLPRLDARRPWPAARFVQLPVGEWPWERASTVAMIRAGFHDVMGRTWHIFDSVKVDGERTNVMVLRQRTGEVIALVVSTGPRAADRRSTQFRVLEGDPAKALASFLELTGFTEDLVVPASQGTQDMAQPMTEDAWRAILNQLLYVLEYYPAPDDAAIDAIAENMVERRILPNGPEEYRQAYAQALQASQLLGPQSLPSGHDEASLRGIIARLLPRLDARRPWPDERFVKLQTAQWPYADAPTTAVVRTTRGLVEERIWQVFDYVGVAGARTPVVVLRQRTGEVVALIASTGPRPQDRSTVALRVLHGGATSALASFMELTGFGTDMVVTPDQEPHAPTSTPLMDPGELELYRVFPNRGQLWRADDGSRFDTKYGAVMRSGGPGRAIYVMDSQGNLYASTVELIGTFHHSSFLSGGPVAGAGELVVHNGELAEITGRSPQYPVSDAGLRTVLAALGEQGLDTTNVVVA